MVARSSIDDDYTLKRASGQLGPSGPQYGYVEQLRGSPPPPSRNRGIGLTSVSRAAATAVLAVQLSCPSAIA